MQTIKQSILSVVIGLALVAGISYADVWKGATANPPLNNAPAPINVGILGQIKTGGLQVNGFTNKGGSIFEGSIQIPTGAGARKVLTSIDAEGNASWEAETTVSYCAQSWGAFKNFTNDAIMDVDFLRYSKGARRGDYQVYDRIGHAYFDYTKWVRTDRWKNLTAEDKAYYTQTAINKGGSVEDQFIGCQCDSGYKLVWTGGCSWGACSDESILPLPGNEVYFYTCAKM